MVVRPILKKQRQANALGPENLARAALKANAAFVTISTDYVFDGEKEGFYTQRDQPRPISVYGHSKLEGERRAQEAQRADDRGSIGIHLRTGGQKFSEHGRFAC